jgi:hypothetical protein
MRELIESAPFDPEALVDRVALAIASEDGGPGNPLGYFPSGSPMREGSWDDYMPQQREAWRRMARAAIGQALSLLPDVEEGRSSAQSQPISDGLRPTTESAEPSAAWRASTAKQGDELHLWGVMLCPGSRVSDIGLGGERLQIGNAALETAHAFERVGGWRPIEIAPRDGTLTLFATRAGGVFVAPDVEPVPLSREQALKRRRNGTRR